jgi:hypothetical protein
MPSKAGAVSINTNRGGFGDVIKKTRFVSYSAKPALAPVIGELSLPIG